MVPGLPPMRISRAPCANGIESIIFAIKCGKDALPADEFKLLDERLARWTADQQRTGRLPPDYELRAKSAALAKEFANNRDEARPIFTVEEQRDVDASRAAST